MMLMPVIIEVGKPQLAPPAVAYCPRRPIHAFFKTTPTLVPKSKSYPQSPDYVPRSRPASCRRNRCADPPPSKFYTVVVASVPAAADSRSTRITLPSYIWFIAEAVCFPSLRHVGATREVFIDCLFEIHGTWLTAQTKVFIEDSEE